MIDEVGIKAKKIIGFEDQLDCINLYFHLKIIYLNL